MSQTDDSTVLDNEAIVDDQYDWRQCEEDECVGVVVDGHDRCLRHLDPRNRRNALDRLQLGEEVDLRGTTIDEQLLSDIVSRLTVDDTAVFGTARFDHAKFIGLARFGKARFQRQTFFDGAVFHESVDFVGSAFQDTASFADVDFAAEASFDGATFADELDMSGATFHNMASFGGAEFDRASFVTTDFKGAADFTSADFGRACSFEMTLFAKSAMFRSSAFNGGVDLTGAVFDTTADFSDCKIGDGSRLGPCKFDVFLGATDPRLLKLHRVDGRNLTLVGIDLRACRFIECYNRDQLRIDGPIQLTPPPSSGRWTRRQALAEEHLWRARYDRRGARWFPIVCRHSDEPSPPRAPEQRTTVMARNHAARIQSVYRDLRKGREDAKDAPAATDLYYGEMEMRRLAAAPRSTERLLLSVYWLVSGYGLRATRSLVALLVLILIGVIGFGTVGFAPTTRWEYVPSGWSSRGEPVYQQVAVPDARPGWNAAIDHTLDSATALLRGSQPRPVTGAGRGIEIVLRLLGPILLALALLAVRARVKR